MKAINIKEKFELVNKQWHPHQVAVVDDMQVILAKIQGEFVWHSHENEDELFQVSIIKRQLFKPSWNMQLVCWIPNASPIKRIGFQLANNSFHTIDDTL